MARIPVIATAALLLAACTGSTPAGSLLVTSPPTSTVPAASTPVATPAATPAVLWPAPSNPMELTVAAGLVPETVEHLEFHVHAHLDVFLDGKPILVPAGIGIDIEDPGVHTFPENDGSTSYGGIETPCGTPCISRCTRTGPSASSTPSPPRRSRTPSASSSWSGASS